MDRYDRIGLTRKREREKMIECGSCLEVHAVEDNLTYCVVCSNNYDSGCMNEIEGEPVCFGCSEKGKKCR